MNARLTRIASRYYDTWTNDGIDDFHADVNEIAAWLKREDLRTAADAELNDLTGAEIDTVSEIIADMVKSASEPDGMTVITTPDYAAVVDDRDRSPMDLYGGKEENDIRMTAVEMSRNGKPVHIVSPSYDQNGHIRFYIRYATYVNGRLSRDYDKIGKIDLPETK